MLPTQERKVINLLPPGPIINNTSPVIASVNTSNWSFLAITVLCGPMNVATTLFQLAECDTLVGSYTPIVGSRFGTDPNDTNTTSTLPGTANGSGIFQWLVTLMGGRKTFIQPQITVGNGTGDYLVIFAELWLSTYGAPATGAQAGATQRIIF
jgi:hypothetical protein